MTEPATELRVANQGTLAIHSYSTEQIALIKDQVAEGCTDLELQYFLEVAKKRGLDPFDKQIYAIKRNVKKGNQWVSKMTIQVGIDGFRLIAHRTGEYCGCADAEPRMATDPDGRRRRYVEVTVKRLNRGANMVCDYTARAYWDEYVQTKRDGSPTAMWQRMPYAMLSKCAEALALRKAFPEQLSGLYTHDEMAQADGPVVHSTAPQQQPEVDHGKGKTTVTDDRPSDLAPRERFKRRWFAVIKDALMHVNPKAIDSKGRLLDTVRHRTQAILFNAESLNDIPEDDLDACHQELSRHPADIAMVINNALMDVDAMEGA